jgi:hypothetical protein
MSQKSWYRDGLRFECTGCGDCCTGEPGYVWVTKREVAQMAAHLGIGVLDFTTKFTRRVGRRLSLIEMPGGDCVFFNRIEQRCKVYPVRPLQCQTWPFWASNLKNAAAWDQTCRACPGAGRGPLHTAAKIATLAASRRV